MQRFSFVTPLLALLAACAAPVASHETLSGSNWSFVAIDGAGPASKKAHMSFEDDRLGANVGCNGMGGPWRVEDDRLIAGPLVQTEMYCPGPVWNQEQSISALLAGAPVFEIEGDKLILKSSGHSAELRRAE